MPPSATLEGLPLFTALSPATRRRLISGGVQRTYPAGATLFRAGTKPAGVYIVLAGRVRVTRSRDGRQHVVHTEGPGGTLAELPFFEEGVLPATAVAIEPTRCLILSRGALRTIMHEDPTVAWLFLRRLSMRVREVVERLDQASSQSVRARLATFLLKRADTSDAQPFTLGMTQAALAEELGTVREVVVRTLAQLRDTGAISTIGRGRFALKDRAMLGEPAAR
jgi:CRP/FNR family transcriptional regulator